MGNPGSLDLLQYKFNTLYILDVKPRTASPHLAFQVSALHLAPKTNNHPD